MFKYLFFFFISFLLDNKTNEQDLFINKDKMWYKEKLVEIQQKFQIDSITNIYFLIKKSLMQYFLNAI